MHKSGRFTKKKRLLLVATTVPYLYCLYLAKPLKKLCIIDVSFFSHMRKFWIDPVTIFKLLRGFTWSPSNQKLLTLSKIYILKNAILQQFLFMVKNPIKGPCGIFVAKTTGGFRLLTIGYYLSMIVLNL